MRFLKKTGILFLFFFYFFAATQAQNNPSPKTQKGKAAIQYGIASFYSNKFNGRKTANGEIFNQQKLTAAHNSLPIGTYVRITNLRNRKTVVVKINDRLHHRNKRLIDLTKAAAQKLGFIKSGVTRVKLEVIGKKIT